MRMKRLSGILLIMVLSISLLSGCGVAGKGKVDTSADAPAINYVTSIANSKWDEVIKNSTGDQLAIYTQLVPALKNVKQTNDLKRVEIVDRAISNDKKLAFVTVHFVRNVNLPDYGSVLDDKQVLLSMKKIDSQWKVFKMDVVSDLKSTLNEK